MSLIDPKRVRIASVECLACDAIIRNPTDEERYQFSADHTHDNPTLQAWFANRTDPRK